MGKFRVNATRFLSILPVSALIGLAGFAMPDAEARTRHHSSTHSTSHGSTRSSSSSRSSKHHGRHQATSSRHTHTVAVKPRYAYPSEIFMMHAPEFDRSELPLELAQRVRYSFESGTADNYTPAFLVRAGAVQYYPLRGGIFTRREKVKYIIVHSTETGVPQDACHVIDSWSSGGRRHPGAQYVVDRDGTIYQSCDPDLATVHVNIFKTLPGINNDNSVGIEMVHAGAQTYTPEQRASVIRLVSYLQDRYHVLSDDIITHRYAQQGDHTDPVAFDWDGFLAMQGDFHNKAIAMKGTMPVDDVAADNNDWPTASVYLEMHKTVSASEVMSRRVSTPREQQQAAQMPLEAAQVQPVQSQLQSLHASPYATAPSYPARNYLDTTYAPPAPTASKGKQSLPIRDEIELPPGAVLQN